VGDRKTRLAQYALLGIGGIRALRALGIDPGVVHLNEGHPALAPVELAAEEVAVGESPEDALARATARTAFTTHTPLPAGNETYSPEDALSVLGSLPQALGMTPERFLALGRSSSEDGGDFGMTTLALRLSRSRNGVSRRHGEVARAMWQPLFGEDSVDDVPIGHVTNGVHVATWMAPPIRELLARHLGATWSDRAADPESWDGIERVPDEELWAVRTQLRRDLVALLRERTANDRLARGESSDHVLEASRIFDPEALTIGFARRVALYKRIYLLVADTERAGRILHGPPPVQFVLGGKAHPDDEEAKRALQGVFASRWGNGTDLPVAYLEDYDIGLARHLVAGCDLWLNLPRAPLEASGTSGMKAALNGGVNLSVLDGWWAEAFDGTNGWGIDSDMSKDPAEQDRIDAEALYRLLESEVVPLFHDRDEAGVPRAWLARVKASMRTAGAEFSATRMMRDYVSTAYLAAGAGRPGR
jgi:starch phosphorylase